MADVPEDLESIARPMWDMIQRVAKRIAIMPLEERESAFAVTERLVRQMASGKIADGEIDDFVNRLMRAIRQFVFEIDVGGRA